MCCSTNRFGIVDEALRDFFNFLGKTIGREPGYFLIVPILLTALCATGFQVDYNAVWY